MGLSQALCKVFEDDNTLLRRDKIEFLRKVREMCNASSQSIDIMYLVLNKDVVEIVYDMHEFYMKDGLSKYVRSKTEMAIEEIGKILSKTRYFP